MGLQVLFAPYLLVSFFFITITIYLERLTNKVDNTKTKNKNTDALTLS